MVAANERRVVELVDEVRLQREALAVDRVLRGSVPVDLVEVVLRTVDHGVALGLPIRHDMNFALIVQIMGLRARLEQLQRVARVLDVRQRRAVVRRDGRDGLRTIGDQVARDGILRDDVDWALLAARGAEATPGALLQRSVRHDFALVRVEPLPISE